MTPAARAELRARLTGHATVVASRPSALAWAALAGGLALGSALPARGLVALVGVVSVLVAVAGGRSSESRRATPPAPGGTLQRVRQAVAVAVVAAGLLAGSVLGEARTAALEHTTVLTRTHGDGTGRVTLLQAPRRSRFGGWSALARFGGEPVLLRVRDAAAPVGAVSGGDARGDGEAVDTTTSGGAQGLPDVGTILATRGSLTVPGDFARSRGAHAELHADAVTAVGRRGGPAGAVDGVRRRAARALALGLGPRAAGLLQGMVLGQDAALPDDLRDDFRTAGLSHLVAASGTNVVLLGALAAGLGAALGLGLTGRLWLVLALIVLYVPLAGGGPSIQRAGIMGAAIAAAGLVGRPAARWHGLGLAAAATLALDPRAVADAGWQLSFAAVLGIVVLGPGWGAALRRWGCSPGVAEVLAMTAAATVATAPIVAAHFDQGSAWAVPVNVLAAPVVAPIMWLGAAVATLGQLGVVGGPVGAVSDLACRAVDGVAGFGVGYLAWLAHAAAALPGATVTPAAGVVLAVCLGVTAATRVRAVRRAAPVLALAGAWLAVTLEPAPAAVPAPAPGALRVTFLDVGQGDGTLLQQGGATVLIDTGPPGSGIVDDLRRRGVRRLDLLVVTHAEADHAGGAADVLAALPVGLVLDGRDGVQRPEAAALGAAAARRHVHLLRPAAGQRLALPGGLSLRVLWPRPERAAAHAGGDPNQRAIVLEADGANGGRVLLGADAESDVLLGLDLRPVDVLKVSHHGSADPGLPVLLRRLRPQIAGIEVGVGNTYGHPAATTLQALTAVPTVVRTDRDGDVRLDRDPSGRWLVRLHG